MKSHKNGRTAQTMSFSLSPEEEREVKQRVKELRPRVANRSHYFQELISLEKRYRLLDPERSTGRNPRLRLLKRMAA